jgi:hypothetical protein
MGFNGISNNDKPQLMDFNVVKHRHKPPMTGKGKHTTDKNRERERGGWFMALFYPHYRDTTYDITRKTIGA